MIVLTDFQKYRHGVWRRIGDRMMCYANQRTIPSGFKPAADAVIYEYTPDEIRKNFGYKYFISVRIEGWTNHKIIATNQD